MKKIICVLSVIMLVICAGCGSTSAQEPSPTPSTTEAPTPTEQIDVDLTKLSSTVVYSEVYQMMTSPDDYIGKTVRMNGSFAIYQNEGKNYFACLIADATACCQQGIEFVLRGEHKYPQDYPKLGTNVTVTGVFGTYYEGENRYCQLSDAVME